MKTQISLIVAIIILVTSSVAQAKKSDTDNAINHTNTCLTFTITQEGKWKVKKPNAIERSHMDKLRKVLSPLMDTRPGHCKYEDERPTKPYRFKVWISMDTKRKKLRKLRATFETRSSMLAWAKLPVKDQKKIEGMVLRLYASKLQHHAAYLQRRMNWSKVQQAIDLLRDVSRL